MVLLQETDLPRRTLGVGQRPALIVVDMMFGFTDPASPLGSSQPEVVEANIGLLRAFRALSLPVIFTAMVYDSDEQASVFRERVPALNCLVPGSRWIEIDSQLTRLENEPVVWKHWASGFFGTDLHARLQALEVDSVVVTGLTTSGCVRATAVDGLQNNYRTVVASDAVGDRNAEAHLANLHDLHAKYVDVQDNHEIIASLSKLPKLSG